MIFIRFESKICFHGIIRNGLKHDWEFSVRMQLSPIFIKKSFSEKYQFFISKNHVFEFLQEICRRYANPLLRF